MSYMSEILNNFCKYGVQTWSYRIPKNSKKSMDKICERREGEYELQRNWCLPSVRESFKFWENNNEIMSIEFHGSKDLLKVKAGSPSE